jgi:hypothetical protein
MTLDDENIMVGESVFDLALGFGTIASITEGIGFHVTFGSGFAQRYDDIGVGAFPNKTLYKRSPLVLAQPANAAKANILFASVNALNAAVQEVNLGL